MTNEERKLIQERLKKAEYYDDAREAITEALKLSRNGHSFPTSWDKAAEIFYRAFGYISKERCVVFFQRELDELQDKMEKL